jgi:phage-related protein (TIGR01555 family)
VGRAKKGIEVIVKPPMPPTNKALGEAKRNADVEQSLKNGVAEALGYQGLGFPQNQGSPWTEQISNATPIFKNMRWYLVSNFRQMLSQAYVEIGLVQTICDIPVDDGLRGGIEINSDQLSEEQIKELQVSIDRDDDLNTAGQAAKWNRLYGGAGVLVLTDQDPETPLDLEAIDADTPLEFRALDMWELYWDKQNAEGYDPTVQAEDFDYYSYYGVQVHKSRVMRLKGLTAPSFIRPRLRGWGFTVVEILVRSINQYLKATDLSYEVLDEFKIDIYRIKNLVSTLMSPLGDQQVAERIRRSNWLKNYQNAIVMDGEDEYEQKQLSFAGLSETMQQIRMQVASDMRMPMLKLFGTPAQGLNASDEESLEVYNSMVESQVRNKLKYIILRMLEIKCQKLFGMVPDDLSIEFKPLKVLSAEQEENVKTQKFNRLIQARERGEISVLEFRDACNRDNLLGISLDTSDETIDGLMADKAIESAGADPYDPKDTDDPGSNREDTQQSKVRDRGGIGEGVNKPKNVLDHLPNFLWPAPYTKLQRLRRKFMNSAAFDRASYYADGGDAWIDERRKYFFDVEKAENIDLWYRCERASRESLGEVRWQFVVWLYKKYGGKFK